MLSDGSRNPLFNINFAHVLSSNGKLAGTKTKSSVSSGLSDKEGGGEGGLAAMGDTPSSTEINFAFSWF